MLDLIEKFRHLIQFHQVAQIDKKIHQIVFFATGTVLNTENSDGVPTFNDQRPFRFKTSAHVCICNWKHWIFECYYLRSKIRSIDWKSNTQMQIKVTKTMKNDRTKVSIEIKLIKIKKYDVRKISSNQTTSRTNFSSKIIAAVVTIVFISKFSNASDTITFTINTFYTINAYSLRNS